MGLKLLENELVGLFEDGAKAQHKVRYLKKYRNPKSQKYFLKNHISKMPTFAREKDTRVDRWLPHKQKKICFYCREVARHGSRFAGYCNFSVILCFKKV